ncbi:MAG TPA: hypothetical protein VGP04_23570 [Pseudonocardiaceae bacterium]|nr:hypothetical protein [Pseudonocardiaceae bacterium]
MLPYPAVLERCGPSSGTYSLFEAGATASGTFSRLKAALAGCVRRIAARSDMVDTDGAIADQTVRDQMSAVLAEVVCYLENRPQ